MGRVEKFEDLIAWQKARELTKQIYLCTAEGAFAKDFGLRDQIRRASVSVMSNIAEGFERGSRAEFHHFLVIAKGSCAEVRSQLYIAKDVDYLSDSECKKLMDLATEVSRIIGGLRASIQKQRDAR
ncbi:four helix bundle protein [Desulfosarcina alkanivorans]|uniref:Four helix bundle protein n=1 Tax=Desulfosarcina alkanivorans TaxID=571177 RepID=A0A5K7YQ22_9BACT|nr:four helix bundle protein [Desulfosarcina alkanivorans]BBO68404.1 four helix bundle protein [Desulfosarcina alkanivorans]